MDTEQIQDAKSIGERIFGYTVLRLQEPSTWRGIVLMLTAMGTAIQPHYYQAIITGGMFLAGMVGVIFPDLLKKAQQSEVHDFGGGGYGFGGFDSFGGQIDNPDVPHETKRAPR